MSKLAPIACLLAAAAGTALMAGCSKDATAYALTSTGNIVQFNTKNPATINSTVTVTLSGGNANDAVTRMTLQPSTGTYYCITAQGFVCTIVPSTGAATILSGVTTAFTYTLGNGNNSVTLSNPVISFDPVGGDLRVITTDYNLLVNPNTGALDLLASKIGFDSSDTNNGKTPSLAGIAYQNPVAGAGNTTLFALDITSSSLLRVGNQNVGTGDSTVNSGDLHTIGALGVGISSTTGFAIAPSDGTAYAILQNSSVPTLYTLSLSGGTASSVGTVGDGTLSFNSLVIAP